MGKFKLRIKYWISKHTTKWITKKIPCHCIKIILTFEKALQLKCAYSTRPKTKQLKKNTIPVNFTFTSYNVLFQSLNINLSIKRIMRLVEECSFTLLWKIINMRIKLKITTDSKIPFLSILLYSKIVLFKLILRYWNCLMIKVKRFIRKLNLNYLPLTLLVSIINAISISILKIPNQLYYIIKLFPNKIKTDKLFSSFDKHESNLIKILQIYFSKSSKSQCFRFPNKTNIENNDIIRFSIITENCFKNKKFEMFHKAFLKFRDRFIITSKKYIRPRHRYKNNIYYRKPSNDLIVIINSILDLK